MSFRNLDSMGDWTWGVGRNNYVIQSQEIALNIKTRVLSFLGDCFFAPTEGIDWWHLLEYGKQAELENAVMATIAATDGVETVEQVESYINSQRKITLTYSYTDVYGMSYKQELIPII